MCLRALSSARLIVVRYAGEAAQSGETRITAFCTDGSGSERGFRQEMDQRAPILRSPQRGQADFRNRYADACGSQALVDPAPLTRTCNPLFTHVRLERGAALGSSSVYAEVPNPGESRKVT